MSFFAREVREGVPLFRSSSIFSSIIGFNLSLSIAISASVWRDITLTILLLLVLSQRDSIVTAFSFSFFVRVTYPSIWATCHCTSCCLSSPLPIVSFCGVGGIRGVFSIPFPEHQRCGHGSLAHHRIILPGHR